MHGLLVSFNMYWNKFYLRNLDDVLYLNVIKSLLLYSMDKNTVIYKNKSMMKKIICLGILCSISFSALAQDVNLFVKEVKEERNSDSKDSFLDIEAAINGIKVDEFHLVKIKTLKAVDNEGNTLERIESYFGDDYEDENTITIKMEAPFRKSTSIENLEGSISYYSPSEENGGVVIINKPLDLYNTNILKKKSKDVKLTLVSKEQMQKLKEENKKEYEAQIANLKKEGVIQAEMAEGVDALMGAFEGLFSFGDSKEALTFHVEDEKELLVEILVFNEKGEKMNYGYSKSGSSHTISLKEEPKNSWSIKILLENEKAVKELKFKLSNILLP